MNPSKQKCSAEHAITMVSSAAATVVAPVLAALGQRVPSVAAVALLTAALAQAAVAGFEWHADRYNRLIQALLADKSKSAFQWATEMHDAVSTPGGRDALIEALGATRAAVSLGAIPIVAAILREYTIGGVRKPDDFFHAFCEVIVRASDDDLRALREIFVKADGTAVASDLVSFGISKARSPNEIQVMVSGFPSPPPIPGLVAGPTVSVRDADYIAQRLIVSGLARSVTLNPSNRKDKMFEQSGFCIPRVDCQRLARLLTAA